MDAECMKNVRVEETSAAAAAATCYFMSDLMEACALRVLLVSFDLNGLLIILRKLSFPVYSSLCTPCLKA